MTYKDLAAVAGLMSEHEQKERLRRVINALTRRTVRGELAAHWWLPLDLIS